MQELFGLTKTINQLIGEDHVIVCGVLSDVIGARRVTTDGTRIFAIGLEYPRTAATDITDAWIYDITEGNVIYGRLPSSCSSRSSPAQEIP